jgi:hypothetical protein
MVAWYQVCTLGSERQPGVSLERLLAAVAVVIQQLLPDVDVAPGDKEEAGRVVQRVTISARDEP